MKLILRFPLLCAVLIGSPASAADWQYLTTSATGAVAYVDMESWKELPPVQIKRPFAVRQIWVKYDLTNDKTETARSKVQLMRFNCSAGTSALISTVSYKPDGKVLNSKTWDDYDFYYEPEVPDTIGYAIMERACGSR
jgi:hypothetical protein